jgi:hypothetical protein
MVALQRRRKGEESSTGADSTSSEPGSSVAVIKLRQNGTIDWGTPRHPRYDTRVLPPAAGDHYQGFTIRVEKLLENSYLENI